MNPKMKRREFITLLGGAAAWPLAARAQPAERMRRVGVLLPAVANDPEYQARVGAFAGAALSGWTDGRNVRIERAGALAMLTAIANTRRNWSRWHRMSSCPVKWHGGRRTIATGGSKPQGTAPSDICRLPGRQRRLKR
jgi:hypothetical protein